jgi:hypothetical protein
LPLWQPCRQRQRQRQPHCRQDEELAAACVKANEQPAIRILSKAAPATFDGWVERPMNPDEVQQLHTLVIEIIAPGAWPSLGSSKRKSWFACFSLF